MERIAGIATGLASSGIGIITRRVTGDCLVSVTALTSRGQRGDGLAERATRIAGLAEAIDRAAGPVALAVIEVPSRGGKGGFPMDHHHLWWLVVARLVGRGVPVAVCAAVTRARFATGNERADKAAMSGAVARLWPGVEITHSDVADAVALAHAGAVRLGWPVSILSCHRDALAGIRWPVDLAASAVA